MGTTKIKVFTKTIQAPLLILKRLDLLLNKENKMDNKSKVIKIVHHFDEQFNLDLDAHLELSLKLDADLIVERKLEEEVDDDLSLIFK